MSSLTVKAGPEGVFEKVFTENAFAPKDSCCKTLFSKEDALNSYFWLED